MCVTTSTTVAWTNAVRTRTSGYPIPPRPSAPTTRLERATSTSGGSRSSFELRQRDGLSRGTRTPTSTSVGSRARPLHQGEMKRHVRESNPCFRLDGPASVPLDQRSMMVVRARGLEPRFVSLRGRCLASSAWRARRRGVGVRRRLVLRPRPTVDTQTRQLTTCPLGMQHSACARLWPPRRVGWEGIEPPMCGDHAFTARCAPWRHQPKRRGMAPSPYISASIRPRVLVAHSALGCQNASGAGRTRTLGRRFWRPLLLPLSYYPWNLR